MDSREPFVRVVFGLLFVCMLATFGFGVMVLTVPAVHNFFHGPVGAMFGVLAMILLTIVLYVLFCSACGKQMPCNIICLLCVVLCECTLVGLVTAKYDFVEVPIAFAVTTAIVFICFLLAFTPLDFTKCYMFCLIFGLVLFLFSIIVCVMMLVFQYEFTVARLVLCCLFTLYHSISFVMTIQMVLGGRSIELAEDDYITGTVMLYMSIIVIFFDILQMIGLLDEMLE